MHEAYLEFPNKRGGGGGVLEKFPSVGEVWIFSGTTQLPKTVSYLLGCSLLLVTLLSFEFLYCNNKYKSYVVAFTSCQ